MPDTYKKYYLEISRKRVLSLISLFRLGAAKKTIATYLGVTMYRYYQVETMVKHGRVHYRGADDKLRYVDVTYDMFPRSRMQALEPLELRDEMEYGDLEKLPIVDPQFNTGKTIGEHKRIKMLRFSHNDIKEETLDDFTALANRLASKNNSNLLTLEDLDNIKTELLKSYTNDGQDISQADNK